MAEISRAALFGKLNTLGYKAIEAATVFTDTFHPSATRSSHTRGDP